MKSKPQSRWLAALIAAGLSLAFTGIAQSRTLYWNGSTSDQ